MRPAPRTSRRGGRARDWPILLIALLAACADDRGLGESRSSFKLVGPASFDFGRVYLGGERSTSVRVHAGGLAPLRLCAALEPAGASFTAQGGCQEVAAGADVEIAVRFAPHQAGRVATFLILTHDAPEPSASVPLLGEGLEIPPCDDGNMCTEDRFDVEAERCVHPARPDGAACSDGKACTVLDVCAAGRCVGSAANCDDDNFCTRDLCEEPAGCVHLDNARRCQDQNPCTADLCDPQDGCGHVALPDGTPCDDGVSCTYADACVSGACRGASVPDDTPCSDDDPCTSDEKCEAGRCVSEAAQGLQPGDVRWTFDSTHASTDNGYPRGLRSPGTLDTSGNLYFDDDPGTLLSLDACGKVRWQVQVTTRNLHLNYRRMATTQQLISVESESSDRPVVDVVRARLLQTGAPLWTGVLEEENPPGHVTVAVRANDAALTSWGAVVVGGFQDVGLADTLSTPVRGHFVTLLDPAGHRRWRTPAVAPQEEVLFGYPLLVNSDGRVFAGIWAGFDPTRASKVYSFTSSGALDWVADWPELNDYLAGASGLLFEASRVRARDFAGRLLWELPALASARYRLNYGAVARPEGGFVFLRTTYDDANQPASELVAVSAEGSLLWRRPLPAQPTASLAMAEDGTVYTAIATTVWAIAASGAVRWTREVAAPDGGPLRNILTLGPPGHLYAASSARLFAVWIGPSKLAQTWSRFRGGNSNGCTIEPAVGP